MWWLYYIIKYLDYVLIICWSMEQLRSGCRTFCKFGSWKRPWNSSFAARNSSLHTSGRSMLGAQLKLKFALDLVNLMKLIMKTWIWKLIMRCWFWGKWILIKSKFQLETFNPSPNSLLRPGLQHTRGRRSGEVQWSEAVWEPQRSQLSRRRKDTGCQLRR